MSDGVCELRPAHTPKKRPRRTSTPALTAEAVRLIAQEIHASSRSLRRFKTDLVRANIACELSGNSVVGFPALRKNSSSLTAAAKLPPADSVVPPPLDN